MKGELKMKKKLWIVLWSLTFSMFALPITQAANKSVFYADKNIVQTIPSSTLTKVIFDVEGFDSEGTFDLANSKWVPGQVGVAYISAAAYWTGTPEGFELVSEQAINIYIFKTGTSCRTICGTAAGHGGQSSQIGSYVYVDSVTDYFEIYLYQDAARSLHINDHWAGITWFSGQMITGTEPVIGDIAPQPDGDGKVNILDLAMLAQHWLEGTGQ